MTDKQQPHRENEVAQAEQESFPASDAPSYAAGSDLPPKRVVSVPVADDCTLHCEVSGLGPKVVFLHAFPLNGRMWQRVIDELAICAVVPDLRGHGRSGTTDNASVEEMAEDVIAALDTLGFDSPVVVCGLSLGSVVALELYRRFPDRVRALCLAGCRPEGDDPDRAAQREALARRAVQLGSASVADELLDKLVASSAPATVRQEVRDAIAANDKEGIAATSRALGRRRDYTALTRTIECPTLLAYGLLDSLTPPEMGVSLYANTNSSRLELISGAAHLAPLEQPARFALVLGDFVERLASADPRERTVRCVGGLAAERPITVA